MGNLSADGPEYDVAVAASLYEVVSINAEARGMTELAEKLRRMADIDREGVQQALDGGFAPIFLHPDSYGILDGSDYAINSIHHLRHMLIDPSIKTFPLGSASAEVDSSDDKANLEKVEALQALIISPKVSQLGYIEPDSRLYGDRINWYMPTVIDGIALQRYECIKDANWGVQSMVDGVWQDAKPMLKRRIELTAYRVAQDETPAQENRAAA